MIKSIDTIGFQRFSSLHYAGIKATPNADLFVDADDMVESIDTIGF